MDSAARPVFRADVAGKQSTAKRQVPSRESTYRLTGGDKDAASHRINPRTALVCHDGLVIDIATPGEWAGAEHWLAQSLPYTEGNITLSELRAMVSTGDLILWTGRRGTSIVAAMLTRIMRTQDGPGFTIEFIGAENLGDWWTLGLDHVEAVMGTQFGCQWVQVIGRQGWVRKLRKAGYQPQHFFCRKRLIGGVEADRT